MGQGLAVVAWALSLIMIIAGLAEQSPVLIGSGVSGIFSGGLFFILGEIVTLLQEMSQAPARRRQARADVAEPEAPGMRWVAVVTDPYGTRSELHSAARTAEGARSEAKARGYKVLSVSELQAAVYGEVTHAQQ